MRLTKISINGVTKERQKTLHKKYTWDTMEYYSATEKNENLSFPTTWMTLRDYAK